MYRSINARVSSVYRAAGPRIFYAFLAKSAWGSHMENGSHSSANIYIHIFMPNDVLHG